MTKITWLQRSVLEIPRIKEGVNKLSSRLEKSSRFRERRKKPLAARVGKKGSEKRAASKNQVKLSSAVHVKTLKFKTKKVIEWQNKIGVSKYPSTVFLWLALLFMVIFSFFPCAHRVRLCRHFDCFPPVSRSRTQIVVPLSLPAIVDKFPLSVDKSVTWFLLCARVFSPASAILESKKSLGTRLVNQFLFQWLHYTEIEASGQCSHFTPSPHQCFLLLMLQSFRSRDEDEYENEIFSVLVVRTRKPTSFPRKIVILLRVLVAETSYQSFEV